MRPLSRDKAPSLLVLALLAASFFVLSMTFPAVHAATPVINNASNCDKGSAGATVTCTLTIATTGDVIAVFGQTVNSADGVLYSITSVTSTAVTGGFTEFISVQGNCVPSSGFCGSSPPNQPFFNSLWIGTATASGAGKSIIINTAAGMTVGDIGGQAYDMSNVSPTPNFYSTGECDAVKNNDCGSPMITASSANPIVASVYLAGAITRGSSVGTAGTQFTINGAAATGGEFAQNTLVPPTNFPLNFNGGSGLNSGYALIGVVFNQESVSTVTTVLNTACLGACSGGNNGTSIYLPPPTTTFFNLHFYASQNIAGAAQVDNVTLKVAAVHITTSTGTFYVLVYGATGQPSGGNPYVLLTQIPVTLSNGSSNFFIHTNPQTNLGSSQYYAVGIMTTTTASRGSGATGSGVSVYETSQSGVVEYKFSVGSTTPPNSFFSSTTQTPHDFIYIHTTFPVATVTTTSTLTLSGLVTSTTTVTTTSTNIINQLNMTSAGFWFIPMIFLLAPMALLIVVKRVADGR